MGLLWEYPGGYHHETKVVLNGMLVNLLVAYSYNTAKGDQLLFVEIYPHPFC